MNTVYVLVPFFRIDSHQLIQAKAKQLIGFDSSQFNQSISVHQIGPNQFALQINNFQLHFLEINHILQQYTSTKIKIQMLQTIIKDYEYQSQAGQESIGDNIDNIAKKMKKYKDLKDQNKKLKKLLQVQLENTQKVRQQTQKTMKVLREQFDALVVEISKKQKNSLHDHFSGESEEKDSHGKQKPTLSGSNGVKHSLIR